MLPVFPTFKKLELADQNELQLMTKNFSSNSDYNFAGLWSYNTEENIIISQLNDNLVIKFEDYLTSEPFYSFLGDKNVLSTISTLLKKAKEDNIIQQLKLIPEADIISTPIIFDKYIIVEDRDNFDYILSVAELMTLNDSKYAAHRKLLSRFKRSNPNYKTLSLNVKEESVKKQLVDFFHVWERAKGRNPEETIHELKALKKFLAYVEYFNILCIGISVNDTLIAFSLAEIENEKCAYTHFAKALPPYSGMNRIMHHYLAKELYKRGCSFINLEQDLGIEGLRTAKQHSKPIQYIKKYIISEKKN